ncbi:MAG: hypothetical protein M3Q39_11245 [Actinomycetota bacterium]|nr:hypothetical protein [Actinomycetota bacterium]
MNRDEHEVAVVRAVLVERERWERAIRVQAAIYFFDLAGVAEGVLSTSLVEQTAAAAHALHQVVLFGGRGNDDLATEMLRLGQWCDAAIDAIDEERRRRARSSARRR